MEGLVDDLEAVEISSQEELAFQRYDKLLPMKEWGFPEWVYAEGAPEGFGKGVRADTNRLPPSFWSNRFIPVPTHLFSKDPKIEESVVHSFHKYLTTQAPLWTNFTHITPTLLLLLTGLPPVGRVLYFQHLEDSDIREYALKKSQYAEGYAGYLDTLDDFDKFKQNPEVPEHEFEKAKALIKLLEKQFTHPPELFVRTKEAQELINQYLIAHRACRIKEDVSLSQYQTCYCPPVLNLYEILWRYHRIRDYMEANGGFHSPQTNQHNLEQFLSDCKKANDGFSASMEMLTADFVSRHSPKLGMVIQSLHKSFDDGSFSPDWSTIDFSAQDVLDMLKTYGLHMIDAIERCLLTMLGVPEDSHKYLSVFNQPLSYGLSDEDNERFNVIADTRAYNDLIHTLRTKYLPGWKKTTSGSVACFDPREDSDAVDRYLKNVLLNCAFVSYPKQAATDFYLRIKQIVRPSKGYKAPKESMKELSVFKTETHEVIPLFPSLKMH